VKPHSFRGQAENLRTVDEEVGAAFENFRNFQGSLTLFDPMHSQ